MFQVRRRLVWGWLLLGLPLVVSAQVPAAERQTLLELFERTDGPNWSDNTGWGGPPGTECTWFGVDCDDGRVWRLVLANNGLRGDLPDISALARLVFLALSRNQLHGPIPDLSALVELGGIRIEENELSGPIPELPTRLGQFQAYNNLLTGPIPDLSRLTELEFLTLSNNRLSGEIPDLSANSRLRWLWLDRNQLTGEIPELSGEDFVDLLAFDNQLTGPIPDLSSVPNLVQLHLRDNQLSGPIPNVSMLEDLRFLILDDNQLTGPVPDLSDNSELLLVLLSGNRLSGEIPEFTNLPALEALWLDRNQLVGEVPLSLLDLDLDQIGLTYNALYSDSEDLETYVSERPTNGAFFATPFGSTQTIAPLLLTARAIGSTAVLVEWQLIEFTEFDGAYRVTIANAPQGPFETSVETADKTVSSHLVEGLEPATTYYLRIHTVTQPSALNQNILVSEPSVVVEVSTTDASSSGTLELTFSEVRVSEGEQKLLGVRRVGGSQGTVSVAVSTTNGTAAAGSDFIVSADLTWQDGDSATKVITIEAVDDAIADADEQFDLSLRDPSNGAELGSRARATITIAEKDLFNDQPQGELISIGNEPAVADDPLGGRIAVWSGNRAGRAVILAQRYDASGEAVGSQFVVSQSASGTSSEPDVAANSDGDVIVVWNHDATSILGRRFDPSGQPIGGQFRADDGSSPKVSSPEVSINDRDEFFVVWQGLDSGLSGSGTAPAQNILGRPFGSSSQPLAGVTDLDGGSSSNASPDVALRDDGDVLVVFESGPEGDTEILATAGNIAEPFEPASAVQVNRLDVREQERPRVATVPGSDDFVVVWQGASILEPGETFRQPGGDVWLQRVSSQGVPLGDREIRVNRRVEGSQTGASVDTTSGGDCVVGWQEVSGEGATSVLGRVFPGCGQGGGQEVVVSDPENTTEVRTPVVSAGGGAITGIYRLDDLVEGDGGVAGRAVSADLEEPSCIASGSSLCLNDGRFQVQVAWSDFEGNSGNGQAVSLTTDTGYFWFFDPNNVELVVKVLDACSFANSFWVFAGGLTNVQAQITVTDTATGEVRRYSNPLGTPFQPVQDTGAFQTCGAMGRFVPWPKQLADSALDELWEMPLLPAPDVNRVDSPTSDRCTADSALPGDQGETLCLNQDRFAVSVSYTTAQGETGQGRAAQLTPDTGYFWFFSPDNVELVIKVLDACSFSNHFWVFAGGLTDVEATVTVTDFQTGEITTYINPLGTPFEPVQDTGAFATCNSP